MFRSRWLLAPFFFGLIIASVAMLVKFGKQLMTLLLAILGAGENDVILSALTLIDTALIASLLLIIALGGYESPRSALATTRTGPHGWARSGSRT